MRTHYEFFGDRLWIGFGGMWCPWLWSIGVTYEPHQSGYRLLRIRLPYVCIGIRLTRARG